MSICEACVIEFVISQQVAELGFDFKETKLISDTHMHTRTCKYLRPIWIIKSKY